MQIIFPGVFSRRFCTTVEELLPLYLREISKAGNDSDKWSLACEFVINVMLAKDRMPKDYKECRDFAMEYRMKIVWI